MFGDLPRQNLKSFLLQNGKDEVAIIVARILENMRHECTWYEKSWSLLIVNLFVSIVDNSKNANSSPWLNAVFLLAHIAATTLFVYV